VIERAPFGNTGHLSSRVIFGAAALSKVTQEVADGLFPVLEAHGINHFDTAASYGDAELRLAPYLATHRDDIFLATKTRERTADGARAELERSLVRLGVDFVDLIQLHNLVEDEEWEIALGQNGAVSALLSARDEGLVKFIGVTGHGLRIPAMHRRSLARFNFDSVLVPYNFALWSIPKYRRDLEELLQLCATRSVAVQTIKSVARRRWPEPRPEDRRSWYEPLRDKGAIGQAVDFVLGRQQLFLNSSSDFELLRLICDAAEHHGPVPPDEEMERDGEEYDVTALFDGGELEHI
jgi:aryl-alcohol dehydrogenase-like predicted oxidoreductase